MRRGLQANGRTYIVRQNKRRLLSHQKELEDDEKEQNVKAGFWAFLQRIRQRKTRVFTIEVPNPSPLWTAEGAFSRAKGRPNVDLISEIHLRDEREGGVIWVGVPSLDLYSSLVKDTETLQLLAMTKIGEVVIPDEFREPSTELPSPNNSTVCSSECASIHKSSFGEQL
eukprot:CAMPEP_0185787620 /NCGR_PEP_ID=MMETSP1174-20130828/141739_1 /TAXON_ID=35687 /ORGANISM="Dictyocha speculum, Strain CCMP1381" /LENGTH=168 /DNA_ID=CAMNT_0028480869 /DNA_START=85 /DNA_END=591 /DNA_ORIENTATION=+